LRSRITGYFVCLAILLILGGCGTDADEGSASPGSTVESTTFVSPLVSPSQPTSTPIPSCLDLIEPVGNTICGYIVSQIDGKPAAGRAVFLAEALFSDDGSFVFSALDENSAPQGITDEEGMFFVSDVPPDMYFLMLGDFPRPLMLQEPDSPEDDLYVDWREEGGVVDLGIIPAGVPSLQEP
jgi:hypothetical protein